MKNNIPRFSGTSSNIPLDFACTAHYNFGRIISTEPHQDEITKVDDKHGMETILPKAKYFFISVSTSIFQVKKSLIFFPKKSDLLRLEDPFAR